MTRLRVILLLLSAVQAPVGADVSAQLETAPYREAAKQGIPVYRVDAQLSRADILVFRGGKLARFGHDHLVSTTDIDGLVLVADPLSNSRADLVVPLDSLLVDPDDRRTDYGFEEKISASVKTKTRRNMLEKVLQAGDWPNVKITARISGSNPRLTLLEISFSLHGITRTFDSPAVIEISNDRLRLAGSFTLLQTDYGINPYSVLAGGLRVRDSLEVHFEIIANRYWFSAQE